MRIEHVDADLHIASSGPSSVPETVYILPPASFRTTTIWPRAGYNALSSTPPSRSDDKPVQLTMRSAAFPELCSSAASAKCARSARFSTIPRFKHCDASHGRYSAVLMQTEVNAVPLSTRAGNSERSRVRNCHHLSTLDTVNEKIDDCTAGNKSLNHGSSLAKSAIHSPVGVPASFARR